MKKLINFVKRLTTQYKNSKYTTAITVFITIFLLASVVVFIFEEQVNDSVNSFGDSIWWAFITFSTTGYGDIVPTTLIGRVVTVLTIFIGITAMSFLSGTLASFFVDRNTKARRGLMEFPNLKNHMIICGWKDHMKDILLEIISAGEDLDSENIVLISNIESEKIEELRDVGELKNIRFVRGDYFSEVSLNKANAKESEKILVLADTLESDAISEVDSKTVMTVLTAKAMSKDVYVCAELLDKKYESYLRQALCDEILYIREVSRRVLANTSAMNGMSHIVYDLLSNKTGTGRLKTYDIPGEFIGKEYGDYKSAFGAFDNSILLGILENTGSPNRMKIEALREAQKTSDVSALVTNLHKVKELEVNKPVLMPQNNYILQKHTKAIVLEKVG